ncbi:MAG: sarcosine oxidase subunit gamma family protein [Burkholderiales bacterium]
MAESLMRELASPESCFPGQFGAPMPRAGVVFSALTGLALIDLRGDPQDAAFLASAQSALGCALPLALNTTAAGPDCTALWTGPDAWLVVGSDAGKFSISPTIPHGFATDVSHGRAAWRISGARTLDLLAKGCSLDLHPRAFQIGQCAQTSLAHVGVLLHRREDGIFDLYCARSYAQHMWHWLTEAADEYGYEVALPFE